MKEQKTRRLAVAVACENTLWTIDGVERDGKLWLVPKWIDYPQEQVSQPTLMIRFDNLRYQGPSGLHDYVLAHPIPRFVLDGETTEGYETLSGKQITFALPMMKRNS